MFKYIILIFSVLVLTSCSKEFLNNCDSESSVYKPLEAKFTYSKSNQTISFINESKNADTYLWDFGNGKTSILSNPVESFLQSPNPYIVKLTAKRCNGERTVTTSQNLTIACGQVAPPLISPSGSLNFCSGGSVVLSAVGCSGGSFRWNTGATTQSITTSNSGTYSAQCIQNTTNCPSITSNTLEVKVIPLAAVKTVGASHELVNSKFNVTINGIIDFRNDALTDGTISDHGFIFVPENISNLNTNSTGIITVSLGSKKETSGIEFQYIIKNQTSRKYTYRAFVKKCDGSIIYDEPKNYLF